MGGHERRAAYGSLWIWALAFGFTEAAAVIYLREIYIGVVSLQTARYFATLPIALVSLPARLVALEMLREVCTIVLLASLAWLAGRRLADRAGAFLLSFGVWDLTYYTALKLLSGWPDSLRTWDILFLVPSPWVAPVWAPLSVATLFVAAGTYLFWTPERKRAYHWPDVAVLVASVLLTIVAFLAESRAAMDHRLPERFPVWLFWTGVVLGTGWFVWVERRSAATPDMRKPDMQPPWVGVSVRAVLPEQSAPTGKASPSPVPLGDGELSSDFREADLKRVMREYTEATHRLEVLTTEAGEVGERLDRLAHGLGSHPTRLIIGLPDESVENPSEWDMVSNHPLPSIDDLATLTAKIREAKTHVDELRERLILLGRADVVAQPGVFFH